MFLSIKKIDIALILLMCILACSNDTRLQVKAARGDPVAMRELGYKMWQKGSHNEANEGIRWLEKAAKIGDAEAMDILGTLYDDSPICSSQKSLYWYQKGAEAGNKNSMVSLGNAYRYGQFGLKKDPVKSKYWFDKADAIDRQRRGF